MAGTSGRIYFHAISSLSSSLAEAEHAKSSLSPSSSSQPLRLPDSLPSRAVALRGEGPGGQRVPTMKESSSSYLYQPTKGGIHAMAIEILGEFQIPIEVTVQEAPVEVPVVAGTVYCNWEKGGRTVVEYWGVGKGGGGKGALPYEHLRWEVWGLKTHRSVETWGWGKGGGGEGGYEFQKGAFWFEHEVDEIYEVSIFCQDTEVFSSTVSPGSGVGGAKGKGGGDGGWKVLVAGTASKGGGANFRAFLDRFCFVGEAIGCQFRKGLTRDLKVALIPMEEGAEPLEAEVVGQGMTFSPDKGGRYLCVFSKGDQRVGSCPVDILDGSSICGHLEMVNEAFSSEEVIMEVKVLDKKSGLDLTDFLSMESFFKPPFGEDREGKKKGKKKKGEKLPLCLTYGEWEEEPKCAFGVSMEGGEEGKKKKKGMRGEFVAEEAGEYEIEVVVSLFTRGKEGGEGEKEGVKMVKLKETINVEDLGQVLEGSIQCAARGDVGRPHRVNARLKNSRNGKVLVSEDIRVIFRVANEEEIEATSSDFSHFEFVMREPGLGVVDVTWRGRMMGRKAVSFQHNIEDLKSEVEIPSDIRIGKEQEVVVSLRNTRTNEALRVCFSFSFFASFFIFFKFFIYFYFLFFSSFYLFFPFSGYCW